ncbi:Crp/Fnr family transcriptional regulator [Methylobacterium sp. P1-11]|uniref:Crp/Fnr family transcriptional regulator n=1 Tax=Methylobacterium sp. P1-11 TaxID=2024616 RepID=UPI0011EBC67B|nr:Crp/Fnr family transcriptional regulator [Methylobacterium sp. P1-11]KAA0121632.1 Crp/Fnr family transcriptional regulator [Methylobacterium sp. P1-11]
MSKPHQHSIRNRLLKVCSGEDFGRLAPQLQLVDLPVQEVLIRPNEPVQHLYFIESGLSSIVTEGSMGRVEVGIVGREGLVGALPVLTCSDRMPNEQFIQMPGNAYRIDADVLSAAVDESRTLRRLLLRYVQAEFVQTRQTAYVNATYTIETRLARWLLMCHDRSDGDELLLKHEFLSMMLGVQRSGVTLALQNLEGGRCIRGRRGRVQVLDRELLRTVADGSYGLPEAEYARLIEGA